MPGSLPGERRGGRRKGTPNRATAAQGAAIAASGLTPLEYMLSVLRDETAPRPERMEAAARAAPYVHPRLAAIEYIVDDADEEPFDLAELTTGERDLLRQLAEKRLKAPGSDYDQPGQSELRRQLPFRR